MKYLEKVDCLSPCLIRHTDDGEEERILHTDPKMRVRELVSDMGMIALLLILWLMSEAVLAGEEPLGKTADIPHRSLWLKSVDGKTTLGAKTLATDVSMQVSGPILRAKVRQKFRNASQFWMEGIYSYPLPEQAVVDRMRMVIGERVIEGQIHEKQNAKTLYQKAKKSGKRTSLLNHHRSNIFTTSIANIGPGETITVEFEFQQVLDFKDNRYSLRFPMVSTPQYTPPRMHLDPDFVEPINAVRGEHERPGNPVSIVVDLKTGFPIDTLVSRSHPVKTKKLSESHYRVKLEGVPESSNRDFVMFWEFISSPEPIVRVLREDQGEATYGLLMVMPPQADAVIQNSMQRELVFVLDVSGSMQGESIAQARSAVLKAMAQLRSKDRFNLIFFNTQAWKLFPQSKGATQDNLRAARYALMSQKANGGTQMVPAFKVALGEQADPERLRQVVFITDGAISNEEELFSEIVTNLGHSRLFIVGIGSAPNSYFMRKAARAGRGTFTYIGRPQEVDQNISNLLRQLEAPALTDLRVDLNTHSAVVLPQPIPDLYAGEPVYVAFKARDFPDYAQLYGELGGIPSYLRVDLQSPFMHTGIAVEWARRRISGLLDQYRQSNEEDKPLRRQEIVDIALAHHQVSKFTSLVAVDVTPVRAGGLLNSKRISGNRPKGWVGPSNPATIGIRLAQTATGAAYKMLMGALFLLVALMLWYLQRRRAWLLV